MGREEHMPLGTQKIVYLGSGADLIYGHIVKVFAEENEAPIPCLKFEIELKLYSPVFGHWVKTMYSESLKHYFGWLRANARFVAQEAGRSQKEVFVFAALVSSFATEAEQRIG